MAQTNQKQPRVLIVGGGFAGLNVAKSLSKAPVQIFLIDKQNYHLFQPLLYQVATAELESSHIASPIRSILRKQKNVEVVMGEITGINLEDQTIKSNQIEVDLKNFHYLVIATGVQQSYFGHDEFALFAPGMKTLDDALEIRRRMLLAFEAAEREGDEAARKAKLTFIIVGGGPTGVELAGALADVSKNTLPREYHHIDTTTTRIILIEGSPRLLGAMPEKSSDRAKADLEDLGVEVHLHSRVTEVDADGVVVDGERIMANNVFWAAGVHGQKFLQDIDAELDRSGRIIVNPDCSIGGHPNIFAVGDAAQITDAKTGTIVPGVAQGALQTGKFVAKIIRNDVKGTPVAERPAFKYLDKGSMAVIGRGRAVTAVGDRQLSGFVGWLTWSFIHVVYLVGFRQKFAATFSWFWNYLVHTRQARLIIGDHEMQLVEEYARSHLPKADVNEDATIK